MAMDSINIVSIYLVLILLSIIVIYYIYCLYNKHSNIFEEFEIVSKQLDNNYGEGHSSGREGTDKELLEGDITLRPCQVYFVGKSQHSMCDNDTNDGTTCKYEFTDNWMEIDKIKDPNGKVNTYSKKIYAQDYSEKNVNHEVTSKCFKKFGEEGDTRKRYIYNKNELLNYEYGGTSDADTIELNYLDTTTNSYKKGNYISMKFNNNLDSETNYNNIIHSICSKKYLSSGLTTDMKFYKYILDKNNYITAVKNATLNGNMKSFTITDVNMEKFLDEDSVQIMYDNHNNKFKLIKTSKITPNNVEIYKFKFNYLCNDEESGVIQEYNKKTFQNNKTYLNLAANNSISAELKLNGTIIKVPDVALDILKDMKNPINKNSVLDSVKLLKSQTIESFNESPLTSQERLKMLEAQYIKKKTDAEKLYTSFGVTKNITELLSSTFNVIDKNRPNTPEQTFKNVVKLIQNYKNKLRVAYIESEKPEISFKIERFENQSGTIKLGNKDNATRWKYCATEGGVCKCTGKVYYGVSGRYYNKDSHRFIRCNNGTFGDPYWGRRKYCYCQDKPTIPEVRSTFTNYDPNNIEGFSNDVEQYDEDYKEDFKLNEDDNYESNSNNIETFEAVPQAEQYQVFKNEGIQDHETAYFELPHKSRCDILIVGGGGGGGAFGGGGGGGEVLYGVDVILEKGYHNIWVGKGGDSTWNYKNARGGNGEYSMLSDAYGNSIMARGGGGGGTRLDKRQQKWGPRRISYRCRRSRSYCYWRDVWYWWLRRWLRRRYCFSYGWYYAWCHRTRYGSYWFTNHVGVNGFDGGSGGGGGHTNDKSQPGIGGGAKASNKTFRGVTFTSYGNIGGNGRVGTAGRQPNHASGGGGGAGSRGENSNYTRGGGYGGIGINLSSTFTSAYGDQGYFGGGGGGMTYHGAGHQGYGSRYSHPNIQTSKRGGGGNGGFSPGLKGEDGQNGTGGGGGGGNWATVASSGRGGSGIIIIKVKDYIMESQTDAYQAEIEKCISEGSYTTDTDGNVICDTFTNYDKNSIEHFKSLKVKPKGYKDGVCGGYVFLEKGKTYTNFSVGFSTIQSVNVNILNSTISPIGMNEIETGSPLADSQKKLVNFTPSKSGFYNFKCKFFINSIDKVDIESYIEVKCDGINLMDYMYNGDLWPSTWNSSNNSTIRKIYLFNNYLRDVKLINNDVASLTVLKDFLNNQTNDMFNYNYWNKLLVDNRAQQAQIYLLTDDRKCKYQQPYKDKNFNFVSNCDKIEDLNRFYNIFEESLHGDNIKYLFRNKAFEKPTFQNASSEIVFTDNIDKNIINYITYEKKDDKKERTQKFANGSYYNYFEDEETQKSIYVLQSS